MHEAGTCSASCFYVRKKNISRRTYNYYKSVLCSGNLSLNQGTFF